MKTDAVIVAAGSSTRFGAADKLFADLGGRPLIAWSIRALLTASEVGGILIVSAGHNLDALDAIGREHAGTRFLGVVLGGAMRSESVAAGLAMVTTPTPPSTMVPARSFSPATSTAASSARESAPAGPSSPCL